MSERVRVTVDDGVGTLVLARAGGNAIDIAMYGDIVDALARLGSNPDARVILVRADGMDFSVGEDWEELGRLEREGRYDAWTGRYRGWIGHTWHNPKLVVAEVRGRALGIGCELALLADVTFAAADAQFGHPETARGIAPWTIWPWLVGSKLAKEYLATGRPMSAERAHLAGLINAALPSAELEAHVQAFVADIASMPAGTPGANKKRINWAFRDVSRVLHDDRFYDVDFGWLVASRAVDQGFYKSVADSDVRTAIRKRDSAFR
jgi:enoyl-CoA hydratase/carnithine racemase